jgi:LCP family protein required for cell wall assembly
MPQTEKPYRLYRGGRAKGRVPLERHTQPKPSRDGLPAAAPGPPRRQRRFGRWIALALVLGAAALVAWLGTSYLAFSNGIDEANGRVPRSVTRQLTQQEGLLTSTPATLLVLGTDGATNRPGARRSDSIMLVRTNPRTRGLAFLSIPRDLRVDIPGYGTARINAASQIGGPTLMLQTVKELTGLQVNHVALVDFDRFRELIDAVGGIELTVPRAILSNRFDCPYASQERCDDWPGWRFERGTQRLDGRRALVYSRVRENRLHPSETDFDRARRQQEVVQATADKVTSLGTALRLPFIGADVVKPLATDLSAGQLLQLGWAYFRTDRKDALHCRLGGEPAYVDGEAVILGSEDNLATVAMFTGQSAPLPPPRGQPFAPGCVVGERRAR